MLCTLSTPGSNGRKQASSVRTQNIAVFSALKKSLFYKDCLRFKSPFHFSSGKHKQKPLPLGGSIKRIFLALNCQPSRNEIIQLVINPGCKLLERAPSTIDISITGSGDARLCLQIKVILKARGRRKCLRRHQILLWEWVKRTIAIYSL